MSQQLYKDFDREDEMKKLVGLCIAMLLFATAAWAQNAGPADSTPSDSATPASTTPAPDELEQLKAIILQQQKQLAEQRKQLDALKQQLQPAVVNATLSTSAA